MPASERATLMQQRRSDNYYGAARISVTRGTDGVAAVSLRDAQGRARIVMGVAADGAAA
jgi:hypothetical protein